MSKILLISGHGAGDPGASGNGVKEADLTIELANLVYTKLSAGYVSEVMLYPIAENAYKDVKAGKFNVPAGVSYVFEIHFNAFNTSAFGAEIYVCINDKTVTVEQEIMKNLSPYFKLRTSDGVKRDDFAVINHCWRKGIESALLETCFIDNANDMRIYQANKHNIAQGIADGIAKGLGLKKKTTAPTTPGTATNKTTYYRVVAGSFTNRNNADNLVTELKRKGYNPFIDIFEK